MKWLLLIVVLFGNGKIGGPTPVPVNNEEACRKIEEGINEIGPGKILQPESVKKGGGIKSFEVFCIPLYMTADAA